MTCPRMARRVKLVMLLLSVGLGIAVVPVALGWEAVSAAETSSSEDASLSPRLVHLLEVLQDDDMVPVIVTTAMQAGETDEEDARAAGAQVGRRFSSLNGFSARVPAGSLRRLARGRNVLHVSYDLPVRSFNDLNYVTVGADVASRRSFGNLTGLDGSGVTVAVVDSGIADHPDIGDREILEVEIVGHEKGFADYYGHGTHVAGIIAGNGASSSDGKSFRRFTGIAPRATLVSVRVLDANGGGRVSDVLSGIDWVVANRDRYRIRVLNLSLGHPVEQSYLTDPLCLAVERAWKAGIVVVAAAGNDGTAGYATVHSPANDPYVLTVGASNNYRTASRSDDILTTYTSRGPSYLDHVVKPDLVAPGNRTISLRAAGSTLDRNYPALRVKQGEYRDDAASFDADSPYFQLSGSSMSAGVVSGMVALMIQADPGLNPDTIKARLMKSAEKRLDFDVFSEGAGLADLNAALDLTGVVSVPALSPKAIWTDQGIVLQDAGQLWQDAAWGGDSLWGADPLRGTGGVWADAAVWMNALPDATAASPGRSGASSVVWGGGSKCPGSASSSSVVWGGGIQPNSVVWGGGVQSTSVVWGGGIQPDSVVWGGGIQADSVVWGGGVQADSVVWGGGIAFSITGDNIPAAP
jgi:serine protease AprX